MNFSRIVLGALALATCSLSGAMAAAASGSVYFCDTEFAKGSGHGFKPNEVAFQVVDGASHGKAVDPINYRRGKVAKAKQKFSADGQVTLSWKMQLDTSEGYQMGGNIRVIFDPATKTGAIRTYIPARLVNGGTVKGTVTCSQAKALPRK